MVKGHIPTDQLRFHPHSFADPDGRLFWLDGELYRAISHEKTPFFTQLFENGTVPELIRSGLLVRSELTDLVLDGYGMVLQHKTVPFASYPTEWCLPMFKDAAIAYLDVLEALVRRGLTLKDTHPWNLLFDGTRPVFVDITSITPLSVRPFALDYDKFCRYYLHPLILMSQGQERIARHLLPDYEGILRSDFLLMAGATDPSSGPLGHLKEVLRHRLPPRWRELLRTFSDSMRSAGRKTNGRVTAVLETLTQMRRQIEAVVLPVPGAEPNDLTPELQRFLEKMISQLAPRSILSVGAKTLWYSSLAAHVGSTVVVFDKDPQYLSHLYRVARASNLPVLPLVMDVTDPTPSRGLSNHISIAATNRLQCDLVVALSLVNPLMSERRLRLEQVVESVAQFSRRWLIIDYTPRDTLHNFSGALLKHFRTVTPLEFRSDAHSLLLCEK
jgi:hypothetical protein